MLAQLSRQPARKVARVKLLSRRPRHSHSHSATVRSSHSLGHQLSWRTSPATSDRLTLHHCQIKTNSTSLERLVSAAPGDQDVNPNRASKSNDHEDLIQATDQPRYNKEERSTSDPWPRNSSRFPNKRLRFRTVDESEPKTWHNKDGKTFDEKVVKLGTKSLGKQTEVIILREGKDQELAELAGIAASEQPFDFDDVDHGTISNDNPSSSGSYSISEHPRMKVNLTDPIDISIHGYMPKTDNLTKEEYQLLMINLRKSFTIGQLHSYRRRLRSLIKKEKYQMPNEYSKLLRSRPLPNGWRWLMEEKATQKEDVLQKLIRDSWGINAPELDLEDMARAKRTLSQAKWTAVREFIENDSRILELMSEQTGVRFNMPDKVSIAAYGRRDLIQHAAAAINDWIDSFVALDINVEGEHQHLAPYFQQSGLSAKAKAVLYDSFVYSESTRKGNTNVWVLTGAQKHVDEAIEILAHDALFMEPVVSERVVLGNTGSDTAVHLVELGLKSSTSPLHLQHSSKHNYSRLQTVVSRKDPHTTAQKRSTDSHSDYTQATNFQNQLTDIINSASKPHLSMSNSSAWNHNHQDHQIIAEFGHFLLSGKSSQSLESSSNSKFGEARDIFQNLKKQAFYFLPGGVHFPIPGAEQAGEPSELIRFRFFPISTDKTKTRSELRPEIIFDFEERTLDHDLSTSFLLPPKLVDISAVWPKSSLDISVPSSVVDVRVESQFSQQANLERLVEDAQLVKMVRQIPDRYQRFDLGDLLHGRLQSKVQDGVNSDGEIGLQVEGEVDESNIHDAYALVGVERRRVVPFKLAKKDHEIGDDVQFEWVSVETGKLGGQWEGYRVKMNTPEMDLKDKQQDGEARLEGFRKGMEHMLAAANIAGEERAKKLIEGDAVKRKKED